MGVLGDLTGRTVAQKVDEYTEVVGDVLLGHERRIEDLAGAIDNLQKDMQALRGRLVLDHRVL